MGKRASTGSSSAAKAAKAGKADAFAVELQLLSKADLPATCQQMLAAMLPHCLDTAEAERHTHQASIAAFLEQTFSGVEAEKSAAVEASLTAVAKARNVADGAAGEALAAKERMDLKIAARDTLVKVERDAFAKLEAAKLELETVTAQRSSFEDELTTTEKEKTTLTKFLEESWNPLKVGSVVEKAQVVAMQETFKGLGLQTSFIEAVPGVVKLSPEARGDFATAIVEFGEKQVMARIAKYQEFISNADSEKLERVAMVNKAEAAVVAVGNEHGKAVDTQIVAENELGEATEVFQNLKSAQKDAEATVKMEEAAAADAKAQLDAVQQLLAQRHGAKAAVDAEPEPVLPEQ